MLAPTIGLLRVAWGSNFNEHHLPLLLELINMNGCALCTVQGHSWPCLVEVNFRGTIGFASVDSCAMVNATRQAGFKAAANPSARSCQCVVESLSDTVTYTSFLFAFWQENRTSEDKSRTDYDDLSCKTFLLAVYNYTLGAITHFWILTSCFSALANCRLSLAPVLDFTQSIMIQICRAEGGESFQVSPSPH